MTGSGEQLLQEKQNCLWHHCPGWEIGRIRDSPGLGAEVAPYSPGMRKVWGSTKIPQEAYHKNYPRCEVEKELQNKRRVSLAYREHLKIRNKMNVRKLRKQNVFLVIDLHCFVMRTRLGKSPMYFALCHAAFGSKQVVMIIWFWC